MKVVYVAGAYSAPDCWQREGNVRAAEAFALQLVREGFCTVCPHTMARHWYGAIDEPTAIAHGLALLERCDALILVDPGAYTRSRGTHGEIVHACSLGIPCFAMSVELRAWARGARSVGLYSVAEGAVVSVELPAKARTA